MKHDGVSSSEKRRLSAQHPQAIQKSGRPVANFRLLVTLVPFLIPLVPNLRLGTHLSSKLQLRSPHFGQAARSFAAISLYSASASFLLGAGVPGAFPPKEGMT